MLGRQRSLVDRSKWALRRDLTVGVRVARRLAGLGSWASRASLRLARMQERAGALGSATEASLWYARALCAIW
jgi:hypothetical protein